MTTGCLPLTQTAMLIRGDLAFHDYEGVAVDLDERERLVADLGDKNAMILRNHGTLAVGKNVGECFIRLYYLERACQAQIMALSAGERYQQPAARLARSSPPSKARSACRSPRTCSPGRRSSARPTGSTRASRADLARKAASVSDYRALAKARLPHFLFEYLDGGSYDEVTLRRNVEDLQAVALRQRVLRDVSAIDLSTELFGQKWAMPVGLGPVGLSGLYARRGEVQAAKAAAAAGVPFALSTLSACSIAEVARAAPLWFQLYIVKDRGFVARHDRAGERSRLRSAAAHGRSRGAGNALPRLSLGPVRIDPRPREPGVANIAAARLGVGRGGPGPAADHGQSRTFARLGRGARRSDGLGGDGISTRASPGRTSSGCGPSGKARW